MSESLTQHWTKCEEGILSCKTLYDMKKEIFVSLWMVKMPSDNQAPAKIRASRRGNTDGASVILPNWA